MITSTDIDLDMVNLIELDHADWKIARLEKKVTTRFFLGFAVGWFSFSAATFLVYFLLN